MKHRILLSVFVVSVLLISCTRLNQGPKSSGSEITISTWAQQPLLKNPVAISHDPEGRLYVTETQRRASEDLDIRRMPGLEPYPWQIEDWSMESTEQRRENIKRLLADDGPFNNPWLTDLNGDSKKNWHDLETKSELLHLLEDTNGDGKADKSTLFSAGFDDVVTGVLGGVLWRPDGVYASVIPNLWKLQDTDNDDRADQRIAMFDGLGVHSGIGGHDMHGLRTGPDGKIYWTIGDKGINIETKEGRRLNYPNQGVLMRSNPDGSDFEVVMHGLRNCQEIDFDDFGNWFCVDNDGDYKNEKERLVYILEGADAGWRVNWQMNYSQTWIDSKNIDSYNPWMDEKLYLPHFDGQASYILPPIMNYSDGPCGFIRNPGTALTEEYKDHFFLTHFPGQLLSSFRLIEDGAAFKMVDEKTFVKGIMGTGLSFGPDGALYVADWNGGWSLNENGGIRKIDLEGAENRPIRLRTKELLTAEFEDLSTNRLLGLLDFADRRIRLKAQFELVNRNERAALIQLASKKDASLFPRIHSLWAIRQIDATSSATKNLPISTWLKDSNDEFVRQTVDLIGVLNYSLHEKDLANLLTNENPRIKLQAGLSLAKIGTSASKDAVLNFLEGEGDDAYLRHSGTRALLKTTSEDQLGSLSSHSSVLVRLAAIVALRAQGSTQLSRFLADDSTLVLEEAARAINDDFSVEGSLLDLAKMDIQLARRSEVILRRVINANLRLGSEGGIRRLMTLALDRDNQIELRIEAINAVSTWDTPAPIDRVDKRFRKKLLRARVDASEIIAPFLKNLPNILEDNIAGAIFSLANQHHLSIATDYIETFLNDQSRSGLSRVAAFKLLAQNRSYDEIAPFVSDIHDLRLRKEIELQGDPKNASAILALAKDTIADPLRSILEKQEAIEELGEIDIGVSEPYLVDLANRLKTTSIHPALSLEVLELIQNSSSSKAKTQLLDSDQKDPFKHVFSGGNATRGKEIFENNSAAQCARCHRVGELGSEVGPELSNIGKLRSKEHLLRSLLNPAEEISPGFGLHVLTMKDGQVYSGSLTGETDSSISLTTMSNGAVSILKSEIQKSEDLSTSVMPPMGTILIPAEIRDLLAFLDSLEK